MKIKLLTDKGFDDLKKQAESGPSFYGSEKLDENEFDTFFYPDFEIESESYPELRIPDMTLKNHNEVDYYNSQLLFRFFVKNRIPLSLLFEKRYLAYLTHFVFFDYMKVRWPIEADRNKGRAINRYFYGKGACGRQGILGLVWPLYLIQKGLDDVDLEKKYLHYYFCGDRILRDSVIEHDYSKNPHLFVEIIKNLMEKDGQVKFTPKQADAYPKILQNNLSVTSLDLLTSDECEDMLNEVINTITSGSYDEVRSESEEELEE